MKSLRKAGTSGTPDRESTGRSSFLTAIGARRSIRDVRGLSNVRISNSQNTSSFSVLGDQGGDRDNFKGILDLCHEGDAESLRKLCWTRSIQSKIHQTLNNPVDVYGNTNLHISVAFKDFVLSAVLLVKGADPNKSNRSGVSPTVLALRLFGRESKLTQLFVSQGGYLSPEDMDKDNKGLYDSNAALAVTPQKPVAQKSIKSSVLLSVGKFKPGNSNSTNSTDTLNNVSLNNCNKNNSNSSVVAATEWQSKIWKVIPVLPLSLHAAAYLNAPIPSKDKPTPAQFICTKNRQGVTPLMKASFHGHLDLIKDFIGSAVQKQQIDVIDSRGLSALSYACLSGHLNVVEFLVETAKAQVEGGDAPGIQPWVEIFTPTPLVLASFGGHVEIVRYLLSNGADINARVGSPKGCTAVMIACWMRKIEVVRLLVKYGASFDTEMEDWVKMGLRKLKRISCEIPMSDWDVQGWQIKFKNAVDVQPSFKKTTAKKTQMFLMSADDMEEASRIIHILKTEKVDKSSVVTKCIEQEHQSPCNENESKANQNSSDSKAADEAFDLTEHLPMRGTELDETFMNVFKCVTQLAVAANQHDKASYVIIAAKAIRISTAILELVDATRLAGKSSRDCAVPISPHYSHQLSNKLFETSLLANSHANSVVIQQSKAIRSEFQESLMFTTKIACGIWPPTSALSDMMKAAVTLSKACKAFVDLSNSFGFYSIIDRKLTISYENTNENRWSSELERSNFETEEDTTRDWPRPNLISYEKYKQLNDLLNVEQLSKKIATKTARHSGNSNSDSADPDVEYFAALEQNLKLFVLAVTELKKLQSQKLKDRYIQAANLVFVRANEIIEEIQGFDLFVDFADSFDSVVLDEEDIDAIEKTGVKIGVSDFPAPALFLLDISQQEVIDTSVRIKELGRDASLVWSTAETERRMLEACYPCVLAVKKLFSIAKSVATKIRICWEGDLRRQQEWNRTTTQNDNVMALFEAWRGSGSGSAEECDISKIKLDDKIEGIVFDPKLATVKGGRLSKLVELVTSHNNYDTELVSVLLMCHHSFATSIELLKCLTDRYEIIVPPSNLNEKEFTAWFEFKVKPIQQNVLKVLTSWITSYFDEDFVQNEILLSSVREFIEKIVFPDWEVNGKLLTGTIELKLASAGENQQIQRKHTIKSVPKAFGLFYGIDPAVLFSDATRILELDPTEFAKQLTLSEFEDFLQVRPSECLDQIWASKIEKERAAVRLQALGKKPGKLKEYVSCPQSAISKMISHTNNLTIWIATVIMKNTNVKVRVILLKYFAQCAIKCRELKNYNGITGIVAGLSMAPVARLHRTWRKFRKHYPSISSEYELTAEIVSPKGQYASYRKEMKDIKLPAIPFLGLFFTDLTFIDLGNPELIPSPEVNSTRSSRLINFDKCRKIHSVIKEIQKFQGTPFTWQAIDGIQDFLGRLGESKTKLMSETVASEDNSLSGLGIATEEDLYEQSLIIEPKEEQWDEDSDEEAQ